MLSTGLCRACGRAARGQGVPRPLIGIIRVLQGRRAGHRAAGNGPGWCRAVWCGLPGPRRSGPAPPGIPDRRIRAASSASAISPRRQPDPADNQPPPEGAARGRHHRQRAAGHLGVQPPGACRA